MILYKDFFFFFLEETYVEIAFPGQYLGGEDHF